VRVKIHYQIQLLNFIWERVRVNPLPLIPSLGGRENRSGQKSLSFRGRSPSGRAAPRLGGTPVYQVNVTILFDMPLKEEGVPASVGVQEVIVLEGSGAVILHQGGVKYSDKPDWTFGKASPLLQETQLVYILRHQPELG
jgi:hypothetical protein